MLLRPDGNGVIAIGQASHAWISGQLARAWGNEDFGPVEPLEEVCLAAEQHDVGMAAWDLEPSLDPDTGLPHSFMEMPIEVHLGLWTAGPSRLLSQCRYAALLVSMHGRRLYEGRDLTAMAPAQADAVRAFVARRREFEEELMRSLEDPPERVQRNSDLVRVWDSFSLALCLDWAPHTMRDVPAASGTVNVELSDTLTVDPWPFAREAVTVRCEGRRLERGAAGEEQLRKALAAARWETVEFTLEPAVASRR